MIKFHLKAIIDLQLKIILNNDGICSGCLVHEEKDKLDWNYRKDKLLKLVKPYKLSKRNIYNCIVPISGSRDSYFILDYVINVLKSNFS